MAGSNDRNKSFSSASKGNFNGRTDYNSGRPKRSVETIPDAGDKGIPSGIPSGNGEPFKKAIGDVGGGGDKGIPPMKANPSETKAHKVTGGGIRD